MNIWNVQENFSYALTEKSRLDYYSGRMRPFKLKFYQNVGKYIDLRDKSVLEIGGSNTLREMAFEDFGVSSWIFVDKPYNEHLMESQKHYDQLSIINSNDILKCDFALFNGYAEDIIPDLYGKFDVVISQNAFEHIEYPRNSLEIISKCLKPQGVFYTTFGPIWSCDAGSHYQLSLENFTFNGNPYGLDLRHAHLLLSIGEIYRMLTPYMSSDAAEKLAFEIKNGFLYGVNRFFYEDYVVIFQESPFRDKNFRAAWRSQVPPLTLHKLLERYPNNKQFDVYEIEVLLRK
jgi:SAM-dependent methyltransferase